MYRLKFFNQKMVDKSINFIKLLVSDVRWRSTLTFKQCLSVKVFLMLLQKYLNISSYQSVYLRECHLLTWTLCIKHRLYKIINYRSSKNERKKKEKLIYEWTIQRNLKMYLIGIYRKVWSSYFYQNRVRTN